MNIDICKPLTLNQVCPTFMEHQMIMCFILCEQYSPALTCCCIPHSIFDRLRLLLFEFVFNEFDSNVWGTSGPYSTLDAGNDFPSTLEMVKQWLFAIILSKYDRTIWYDNIIINHIDNVWTRRLKCSTWGYLTHKGQKITYNNNNAIYIRWYWLRAIWLIGLVYCSNLWMCANLSRKNTMDKIRMQ